MKCWPTDKCYELVELRRSCDVSIGYVSPRILVYLGHTQKWFFAYYDDQSHQKRYVGPRKKSWLRKLRVWTRFATAILLFYLARDRMKIIEADCQPSLVGEALTKRRS